MEDFVKNLLLTTLAIVLARQIDRALQPVHRVAVAPADSGGYTITQE